MATDEEIREAQKWIEDHGKLVRLPFAEGRYRLTLTARKTDVSQSAELVPPLAPGEHDDTLVWLWKQLR